MTKTYKRNSLEEQVYFGSWFQTVVVSFYCFGPEARPRKMRVWKYMAEDASDFMPGMEAKGTKKKEGGRDGRD